MPYEVGEMIKLLEADGWYVVRSVAVIATIATPASQEQRQWLAAQ